MTDLVVHTIEKGSDGWNRIMVSSYYQLATPILEQLGPSWRTLGCSMDTCCYATRDDVTSVTLDMARSE